MNLVVRCIFSLSSGWFQDVEFTKCRSINPRPWQWLPGDCISPFPDFLGSSPGAADTFEFFASGQIDNGDLAKQIKKELNKGKQEQANLTHN